MESPVQVTFRAIEPSPAITEYVRTKAAKLDGLAPRIMHCRVAVEAPHKHQRQGRAFRVRVDLTLPGREVVVESPTGIPAAEDVYACIDAAFDGAHRQLAELSRERRHGESSHSTIRRGDVPVDGDRGDG